MGNTLELSVTNNCNSPISPIILRGSTEVRESRDLQNILVGETRRTTIFIPSDNIDNFFIVLNEQKIQLDFNGSNNFISRIEANTCLLFRNRSNVSNCIEIRKSKIIKD